MKSLHTVMPEVPVLPAGKGAKDDERYEVFGVRSNENPITGETASEQIDPTDAHTPDFWSIYSHRRIDGWVECTLLDDYMTRDQALIAASELTDLPAYDFTHEAWIR